MFTMKGRLFVRIATCLLMFFLFLGTVAFGTSLYLVANHHTQAFDAWNIDPPGSVPPVTYQATYALSYASDPGDVAVWVEPNTDPPDAVLFITSESDYGVELVDARTMTSLGYVSGPYGLAGITMDNTNNILYTVDRDTDDLYAYDWDPVARTLTPIAGMNPYNLPNCLGAFGLALDEVNGVLYVADTRGEMIRGYDMTSWNQVSEITVSHRPMGIEVDQQRGYVYTVSMNQQVVYCAGNPWGSGFGSTLLSKYNIATGTETVVDMGVGGADVAVDEATGYVYLTEGCESDRLAVWNTETTPFSLVYVTQSLGSPAAVAIANANVSYNPLNLAKNDAVQGVGVTLGQEFTYEITFNNFGNSSDVTGAMVVDNLPTELDFVSETVDGVEGSGIYDPSARTVTWDIGTIPAMQAGPMIELVVLVNDNAASGQTIHNYATITSNETPPTSVIGDDPDDPSPNPGIIILDCFADLPAPELEVVSCEEGSSSNYYQINVNNYSEFPEVLFDPAPELPPCGLNTNSSRSWVTIYDGDGNNLSGFCDLGAPADLNSIWFAVAPGNPVPENVYIEIIDRQCDIIYTSNLASTAGVSCGVGGIYGNVSADCPIPGTGLMGVKVKLFDADGNFISSATTDSDGGYSFEEVSNGDYITEVQLPLGFSPVSDPAVMVSVIGQPEEINFDLACSATGKVRGIAWWKKQLEYLENGVVPFSGITKDSINAYCMDIFKHFYLRTDGNDIHIEKVTHINHTPLTYDDVVSLLLYKEDNSLNIRIECQLLAAMINVASNRLSQMKVATSDGATISQAITAFSEQYLSGDYSNWYHVSKLNYDRIIPEGIVPLSTPNVMFKSDDEAVEIGLPAGYTLYQNVPNPFNPTTSIEFVLPVASDIELAVYNVIGQKVATLVKGYYEAGEYSIQWNAANSSSGVYFYRLKADRFSETMKMILLK